MRNLPKRSEYIYAKAYPKWWGDLQRLLLHLGIGWSDLVSHNVLTDVTHCRSGCLTPTNIYNEIKLMSESETPTYNTQSKLWGVRKPPYSFYLLL